MKVKTILGVVIALTLVLSLSLTAMAGKPTPAFTVGTITYSVNYTGIGNDQVEASNINWQKYRPYEIQVYLQRTSPTSGPAVHEEDYAPKGRAAKFPQDATSDVVTNSGFFDTGDTVGVQVRLINRKNQYIATTGYLTYITWGTNSTWTAP
ncbi:hypothetical protein ACFLW7_03945 [Chloroflexota bacterium]